MKIILEVKLINLDLVFLISFKNLFMSQEKKFYSLKVNSSERFDKIH